MLLKDFKRSNVETYRSSQPKVAYQGSWPVSRTAIWA